MIGYEIFPGMAEADIKLANIDRLFGYPSAKADTYRINIPHAGTEDHRAAGVVTSKLVNACAAMSLAEKIQYYDENALKPFTYLIEQGWFAEQ